jgi:hypothetical protein
MTKPKLAKTKRPSPATFRAKAEWLIASANYGHLHPGKVTFKWLTDSGRLVTYPTGYIGRSGSVVVDAPGFRTYTFIVTSNPDGTDMMAR